MGIFDQWYFQHLKNRLALSENPLYALQEANADYSDASNPQNALGPAYGFNGLTVGQIIDSGNRRKLLEEYLKMVDPKTGKLINQGGLFNLIFDRSRD